ncbi:RHS repeat-associated core domain-containing protein [Kitasatospora sp. NPDC004289]
MSDEMRHDPSSVDDLAKKFGKHADDLEDSHRRHHGRAKAAFGRTRGKGGLAKAAEKGIGELMDSMDQGQKALQKHLKKVGQGLEQTSRNHKANEQRIVDDLKKVTGQDTTPAKPGTPGAPRPKPGPPKPGPRPGPRPAPPKLRDTTTQPPRSTAKPPATRQMRSDPVDVQSGEMLLAQDDVELPGALPLLLSRTHVSSYRAGALFGPSWASTLDQRVELDAEGALFAAEDGVVLHYPAPEPEDPGAPLLPLEGPRHPMERDADGGTGVRITDPRSGITRHFDRLPGELPGPDGAAHLPLVAIADRNGHRIEVEYAGGLPVEVRDSAGRRIAIETTGPRITALRLLDAGAEYGPEAAALPLVRFGYDAEGHLAEVVNSSGLAMRFGYDAEGRITTWTDRNQRRYRYLYDRSGRCVQTRGEAGHLDAVFAYDPEGRTTTVTDSLGHPTVYRFNEHGQTVSETDALGHTVHREWDDYDRALSRTDALGRTVSFEHDVEGNLTGVTRPDGSRTTVAYNALPLPVRHTGPDGATWRYRYDERGNPTEVTGPSGAVTRYHYDEHHHLAAVTDAAGGTARVECDALGFPARVVDPLGGTQTTRRDAFGRIVEETDALGGTTRTSWTVEGRPLARTGPDGGTESWEWDGEGNLLRHTDPSGGVTVHTYTHFDLPASRTAPDGSTHTFAYDTELRLVQVTNPQGLSWTYRYDPVGNPVSETDFDGRTLAYEHDAAGQLTARTTALGGRIAFTRDALGRVVGKDAAGVVTSYAFDPAGRLRSAQSPTSRLERDYGPDGTTAETVDGRRTVVRYDAEGRRTARRTPAGVESHWTYDAVGNPVGLAFAGRAVTFARDASGREVGRGWQSGLSVRQTWDGARRLSSQLVEQGGPGGALVQRRGFGYDVRGGLVGVEDHLAGPRTFELDAAQRVTAVRARGWTEAYAYDSAGNLTEAEWPAALAGSEAAGPRSYQGTRLTTAGAVSYTHDAAGRVVARQAPLPGGGSETWQYGWDAEDCLVAVLTPDGQQWRYGYDPLGRRTTKLRLAEDGTTVLERTDFVWDGDTLCEQTSHAPHLPGPHTLTWEHEGHHPLAQAEAIVTGDADDGAPRSDRRFFAIVTDLVGTPTELVDENGAVAWRSRSTLWGSTTWPAGSTTYTPLRFPGQYFDPETRLHYNVRRYYDPETARYTSPDPLGLAAAPNPSSYVVNPHTWLDPLGLTPKMCEVVRVYRKEKWEYRGKPGNSYRVEVDGNGDVSINRAPTRNNPDGSSLYVNMGDRRHTDNYQPEDGGRVQSFEVPVSYLERVRATALPQDQKDFKGEVPEGTSWKDYKKNFPEISDPTRGDDLYGIPGPLLGDLESNIIPGSGRSEEAAPPGYQATKDGKPVGWEDQQRTWDQERRDQNGNDGNNGGGGRRRRR